MNEKPIHAAVPKINLRGNNQSDEFQFLKFTRRDASLLVNAAKAARRTFLRKSPSAPPIV